jgi:hypothetical protein
MGATTERIRLRWILPTVCFTVTAVLLTLDPYLNQCPPTDSWSYCSSLPRLLAALLNGPGFLFLPSTLLLYGKFFEFGRLVGVLVMWCAIGWVLDRKRDQPGLPCIRTRWIRDVISIPALFLCGLSIFVLVSIARTPNHRISLQYVWQDVGQHSLLLALERGAGLWTTYGLIAWFLVFFVYFATEVFLYPRSSGRVLHANLVGKTESLSK